VRILAAFKEPSRTNTGVIKEIFDDMKSLDPENVVFNWECCSSWSCQSFSNKKQVTMELIKTLLDRKHMVMCSDFALKALIADWSVKELGPNPFVKIGEFSSSMELRFSPTKLQRCDSAQLVKVGELCENGSATLHALGGTVAFTVQPVETSLYELEVLTVATKLGSLNLSSMHKNQICTIDNHQGAAGHVILHYATGGKLLVSAGHWIELQKLDVSAESLLKVAEKSYGAVISEQIQTELFAAPSPRAKEAVVQRYAQQFVQQSAPCQYQMQMPMPQPPKSTSG